MNNTPEKIADKLKNEMTKQGITAYRLLKENPLLHKQQLYSVLRMGRTKRPEYTIGTLIKVCDLLSIKLF